MSEELMARSMHAARGGSSGIRYEVIGIWRGTGTDVAWGEERRSTVSHHSSCSVHQEGGMQ